MRSFGSSLFNKNSLMAEFSESFGTNAARQQSAIALKAAKVEAELASKAKSEFIANMSHELRTPLNAIIGFSDMLRTLEISDPQRVSQYSSYISEAADHLLSLINDILDVSKMQAGKLEIEPEDAEANEIMKSCELIIDAKAKEKNIELELKPTPGLPHIYADPLRVKQILINLLSNAVKFSPEGGKVSCTSRDEGNGFVSLTVKDNGAGMTEAEIATSLRPFGQVNSSFSKQHEGTGLGLPISLALAKMHHGNLIVNSVKNKGTSVSVFLPTMEAVEASRQAHKKPSENSSNTEH